MVKYFVSSRQVFRLDWRWIFIFKSTIAAEIDQEQCVLATVSVSKAELLQIFCDSSVEKLRTNAATAFKKYRVKQILKIYVMYLFIFIFFSRLFYFFP